MGQCITKVLQEAVEAKAEKERAEKAAVGPQVGEMIFLEEYDQIGTVKEINVDRRDVKIEEIGCKDEGTYKYATTKGEQKWKKITDVPELAPYAPSCEVTASF
uniref:Uncharacterized protein n=1 Tax=Hemiselmis andersenii TaxID=464988 RepID=A0A6U2HTC5_HEMAN|mmetsp:Transcript_41911/g.97767  ORF Transcript_41911/g.97767 Transcript_41911/m.97767 type:complete len:103 (-) Transcript_41911:664-972(-)